jgi:hypothetical protein
MRKSLQGCMNVVGAIISQFKFLVEKERKPTVLYVHRIVLIPFSEKKSAIHPRPRFTKICPPTQFSQKIQRFA